MYIVRADGSVLSREQAKGNFERAIVYPGDAIIVPERFETGNFSRTFKDWGQLLTGFGLAAAAINTLTN
jgi:hypothetical protein